MTNNEYRGRPDAHVYHARMNGTYAHADITTTPAKLDRGGMVADSEAKVLRQRGITLDSANDKLVCAKKGWYRVDFNVTFSSAAIAFADHEELIVELRVNDAAQDPDKVVRTQLAIGSLAAADNTRHNISFSTEVFLADGDSISIWASTPTTSITSVSLTNWELIVKDVS